MEKIAFINEFDLNRNNSAGITVRDLFGERICAVSLQISLIDKRIFVKLNGNELLNNDLNFDTLNKLVAIIKQNDTDVIYSTGNSPAMLLVLLYIKKRTAIPVLFHYFDNWRESRHPFFTNLLLRVINGKHERALVISEQMKVHYRKRFKGSYTTLMVGTAKITNREKKDNNNQFVFFYAGGFHLGRGEALLKLEKILKERGDKRLRLKIATFSSDYKKYYREFDSSITSFCVDIDHAEIEKYYNEVDALLFVEPAPDDKIKFLQYSMSTKIPEYLSSGLPILCFSREGVAPFEYFKTNKAAYLAIDTEQANKCIEKIVESQSDNDFIINNAKLAAQRDFNQIKQRRVLNSVIISICKKVR